MTPDRRRSRARTLLPGPAEPGGPPGDPHSPAGPTAASPGPHCPPHAAGSCSGASQLPLCLSWPHGPARAGAQPAPGHTWARGEMETQMQARLTQLLGQGREGRQDATATRKGQAPATVPRGWGDTATCPQTAEEPDTQGPVRDPQGRGPTPLSEAPSEMGREQLTSPPHPRTAGSGAVALVLNGQLSVLNTSLPLDLFLVSLVRSS